MKTVRDTWLLFERSMSLTVRNPVWVVIGLVQPLYFLVLFGPLLEPLAGAPGFPPGNALNVFVPGLLIQLGLFGARCVHERRPALAVAGVGLHVGILEELFRDRVVALPNLLPQRLVEIVRLEYEHQQERKRKPHSQLE